VSTLLGIGFESQWGHKGIKLAVVYIVPTTDSVLALFRAKARIFFL
jgi:hypothetical protein